MKSAVEERPVTPLIVELPPLPYAYDALAPVISKETMELHHDKHHKKYVDTTNELLAREKTRVSSLEELVKTSSGKLFNNAAQSWNHAFFWRSLSPKGGKPSAALAKRIDADFGGFSQFAEAFAAAAVGQFGSGWAWLVLKNGKLEIVATSNAETPMARGATCLLTLDVWEHAYYVDYRNQRDRYVDAVINGRLNWEFAEENLGAGR